MLNEPIKPGLYKTRGGLVATVKQVFDSDILSWPIHGEIEYAGFVSWTRNGRHIDDDSESSNDLVELLAPDFKFEPVHVRLDKIEKQLASMDERARHAIDKFQAFMIKTELSLQERTDAKG